MPSQDLPRRQAIPVLYTRGTHYEVGFDMGRTFASMIQNFLRNSKPLNEVYIPLYETEEGKNAYNETLETVRNSFPQYIRELEGVADGAQVDFDKLFLLHMDEILPQSLQHLNRIVPDGIKKPVGCSTILVNNKNERILGHTEDALTATLNHYYFVVAHIISDGPQGKYGVKEERFMSLCYAGHLPGYTLNHNHHGLVFSINTLSAEYLRSGRTPRHFLTRALLATENFEQAWQVLKDEGVGAGDGCSINLAFLNDPLQMCYNIEMAPSLGDERESRLNIRKIPPGEYNIHVNIYDRIQIQETNELMTASSLSRKKAFEKYEAPTGRKSVIQMLGDDSGGRHCVFRENGCMDEEVKTIAVGIFDLNARTLALYSDNPRLTKPHAILSLDFNS